MQADGTWEYKPPCAYDVPQQFNTTLLPNMAFEKGTMGAKATGEPPKILSCVRACVGTQTATTTNITTTAAAASTTTVATKNVTTPPTHPRTTTTTKNRHECVLRYSVFSAIRAAIAASRKERGLSGPTILSIPATPDNVIAAAGVTSAQLTLS